MSLPTSRSVYEVSLTDAQKWVTTYVKDKKVDCVRGFLIDADELRYILKDTSVVKYVRVYFGADESYPEHPEKLMLVPVNGMGIDLIDTKGPNSHIFDFTLPCHPTCDRTSPLSPYTIAGQDKDG